MVKYIISIILFLCCTLKSDAQRTSKDIATSDSIEIPFKKITFYAVPNSGLYVIENKKQYKAACKKNAAGAESANYKFPHINFRKYVLMGFGTVHNEGMMLMDNHLYKIESKKMIVFDITIINRSTHDIGICQQYWVLVEKPKWRKYTYKIQTKEVSHLNK